MCKLYYMMLCARLKTSPKDVELVTGDFNGSKFKNYTPHYHQYIDFVTREKKNITSLLLQQKKFPLKPLCQTIVTYLLMWQKKNSLDVKLGAIQQTHLRSLYSYQGNLTRF